jgi:type II secretory pathway pseudopilin PulG
MISQLNSKGDTIVEVLITIAVLSSVLAGAYVTVNRSYINARRAQERSEATKYVETQLEQLKSLKDSNTVNIFTFGSPFPFCTTSTGAVPLTGNLPALASHNTAIYPAACRVGTIPDNYNVSIERTGTDRFTVRGRWLEVTGKSFEEIKMEYRIYP